MNASDERLETSDKRQTAPVASRWSLVSSRSGFSMIELMITVVFVTLGSLLIQGSFLRSADMFGRYSHTLNVMDWMNQECAKAKEILLYSKEETVESESGHLEISGRAYSWTRDIQPIATNLHSIHYAVRWTESGKPMELKNELYVYKKDPSRTI